MPDSHGTPVPGLRKSLTFVDVVLFNIITIFSLRGMATAAKMGPVSIVLWLIAVVAFLLPLGLAVTEMATRDPAEGGLYRWSRKAFGDVPGFLCGWFYWISNVTYLPTLLVFLAGNAVYVIGDPLLGENPAFIVPFTLGILWLTAYLNIRGWTVGKLVTNIGAAASFAVAVLLIAAGAVAFAREGSSTPWTAQSLTGGGLDLRTLGYFGTLSFALAGLELAPIMGDEIENPRRTLPRAIFLSGAAIALLYVLGTSAILVAVPPAEVSPISGAVGALQAVGVHAGWSWLARIGGALVAISVVGGVLAWLGGTARLPFVAGLDRFLPAVMARLHPRHGTPYVSVILQASVTSVLIVASQVGSTVREMYLVLLDMTIVLYFVPFMFLFLSLPRLRRGGDEPHVVRVPGGAAGLWLVTLVGLAATMATVGTAVIPPPDVANPLLFEAKLWGGLVLFTIIGWLLHRRFSGGATTPDTKRTS